MNIKDFPEANWLEGGLQSARYDIGEEQSAWFCDWCGEEAEDADVHCDCQEESEVR